MFPYSFEFALT